MGEELTRSLRVLAERGEPRGAKAVLEDARAEAVEASTSSQPGWRRGLVVALGTAVGVLALIAATSLLLRPFGSERQPPVPTEAPVVSTTVPVTPQPDGDAVGPLNDINDLALGPNGDLWAATSAGVVRWDTGSGGFDIFLEVDGIPGRSVESIDIAPDGTVWIVGDYGVGRFDGSWRIVPGQPGPMAVDQQGAVWVASESLVRYDGSWSGVVAEIDGAPISVMPQDLAVDPRGTLWAVSRDDGVFAFDGSSWRRYTGADGIPEQLWHIAVAPDGAVWAWADGYYTGPDLEEYVPGPGFARYYGDEWTTFTVADGLLANDGELVIRADASVAVVHREWGPDHEETILGVSEFDGAEWTVLSAASGRPYAPIESVTVDADGTLWLPGLDGIVGFGGAEPTVLAVPAEAAFPPFPTITFRPMADQDPIAVSMVIGDFEFTSLQPTPYRELFHITATPYGPVSHYGDLLSWSQDGLTWEQMTVDGGRRWLSNDGADLVLFGRGLARYAWHGGGWVQVGQVDLPGEVQDIAFGHGGAVALADNVVYYSTDGVRFAPAAAGPTPGRATQRASCTISGALDAVAGDGKGFILVTDAGFVILAPPSSAGWSRSPLCSPVAWFSADGRIWKQAAEESPFGPDAAIRDVVGYGGSFVAIGGTSPDDGAVWASSDGIRWQRADIELEAALAVAGGELGWFLTGNADNSDPLNLSMWFSAGGLTWDGPHEGPEGLAFVFFRKEPAVGTDAIFSVAGTNDGIVIGRLED